MHLYLCYLSFLLDVPNHFIFCCFLEGAKVGPIKKKNNVEEFKKVQKS